MSTASLIATIVVAAILIFFLIWGFHRGFLRILLTTLALVVTVVVAGILTPYVSSLLGSTFIGKSIDKKVGTYIEKNIDAPVVNRVSEAQEIVIDKLPLPKFMRSDISEKNTTAEYVAMKVSNFTGYLKVRLVNIILGAIAFVILLILIYLIIRILMGLSKVISKVPIIGGVNRILGAFLGLVEGLLGIWLLCLLVMMLSGTKFGMSAVDVINSNAFLKFFYDNNGIVWGVNALFKSFL